MRAIVSSGADFQQARAPVAEVAPLFTKAARLAVLGEALQLSDLPHERKFPSLAVELTLVIPTFNESGNLRELFRRVDAALPAWIGK